MRNLWKRFWPYFAAVVFWVAVGVVCCSCDRGLKKEIERLREELARQQQYVPLEREKIRDTVFMVTQKIVEVEKVKEVLSAEDRELLKDMGTKISALESYQKMGTQTEAEVTLTPTKEADDKGSSQRDSLLNYSDAWLDLKYNIISSNLQIRFRDSLAIAVEKEYKRKFLWWRWGTKGYQVKAVTFCPYTTIRYNTYVKKK